MTTTLDRADIVAEVDARLAQQLRDHQARKVARWALRAEMASAAATGWPAGTPASWPGSADSA